MIHHSNCGMELFTDAIIRDLLKKSLKTASLEAGVWKDKGTGPGSSQADYIVWLSIEDQVESVVTDVERIRKHPLVPREIPIYGYIYQVETGRLVEVRRRRRRGAPPELSQSRGSGLGAPRIAEFRLAAGWVDLFPRRGLSMMRG